MAKLIYSLDGAFLGEYPIEKERMSVGRRPTNDIHIDNLGISGEHASILTIGNDSFLEDLNSTNGTLVNGKPIKKYVLQHGDRIEFGKFQLKYINELHAGDGTEEFEKTMILRPSYLTAAPHVVPAASVIAAPALAAPLSSLPSSPAPAIVVPSPATAVVADISPALAKPTLSSGEPAVGSIQVLNGPSAGKALTLNKALTTLGKPGVQVAVITKRPQGYFITHVEGEKFPLVNGVSIGAQANALHDHDVIELAGVKMEFYLTKH